jgi:hypothetical protein
MGRDLWYHNPGVFVLSNIQMGPAYAAGIKLHAVATIIAGGCSLLWFLFDVTTILSSSYSGVTMLIFWVGYGK